MGRPEGFTYLITGEDVVIYHHGQRVTILRGHKAQVFLEGVADEDEQELMARLTGNYKRGNERVAREHSRNRNRTN